MDFDTKAFRHALGCFPTGVAVMTAAPLAKASNLKEAAETSHIGITVNSFTSVSLDPPLVLWCIDRRSRRYPYFAEAPAFTVSILASGHKAVSARLAGQGEHSLDGIALVPTELGPPGLADLCAHGLVDDPQPQICVGVILVFREYRDFGSDRRCRCGHLLVLKW